MCSLLSGAGSSSIRALGVASIAFARAALPSATQGKLQALQAWSVVSSAAAGLPSAAGTLSILAQPVMLARGSLPSAAGVVRASATSWADIWGAAGFPSPRIQGYTYTNDPGLQRTQMYSGRTRQRCLWPLGYYQLSAQFTILISDVPVLEQFFLENSDVWFTMTLVTGNAERPHVVRLSGDPSYGDIYGENVDVTATLDVRRNL